MTYTVCVGVDGTAAAQQALVFAMRQAAAHQGRVRVVTAWWLGNALPGTLDAETAIYQRQAEAVQRAALKRVSGLVNPAPPVDTEVVRASPEAALVEQSRNDDQLVVGSEHKGALKRMFEGSVSGYCVRHAQIPVTVVPHLDPAFADLDLPSLDNTQRPSG